MILFLTGGISLVQLLISGGLPQLPSDQLARALAYTLVGLLSLFGHWRVLQLQIAQFLDEAAAPARLIFLYSILLTTLFVVVLNVLALSNQLILNLLGVPAESALLAEGQTLTEWLAAATRSLSIAVPVAILWLPYRRMLTQELGAPRLGAPNLGAHILDPDCAYIQRTLRYSFAWLGLVPFFCWFAVPGRQSARPGNPRRATEARRLERSSFTANRPRHPCPRQQLCFSSPCS